MAMISKKYRFLGMSCTMHGALGWPYEKITLQKYLNNGTIKHRTLP
jgi:hypothetical protein